MRDNQPCFRALRQPCLYTHFEMVGPIGIAPTTYCLQDNRLQINRSTAELRTHNDVVYYSQKFIPYRDTTENCHQRQIGKFLNF